MLEQLGSPHFRQFHDMLLLSIIGYIESDIRPWQSMWYQVLQESHSMAKTKIVIFSRGKVRRYPDFVFGTDKLDVVDEYMYLGVKFNI